MLQEGFGEINPEIPVLNQTFRDHSSHKPEVNEMVWYNIG